MFLSDKMFCIFNPRTPKYNNTFLFMGKVSWLLAKSFCCCLAEGENGKLNNDFGSSIMGKSGTSSELWLWSRARRSSGDRGLAFTKPTSSFLGWDYKIKTPPFQFPNKSCSFILTILSYMFQYFKNRKNMNIFVYMLHQGNSINQKCFSIIIYYNH